MYTQYKVYITPRASSTTYATEIDVSDYVTFSGVGRIRKAIDSSEYDIGVFTFNDVSLTCLNVNGYFNDENDWRSIFKYSRDLAKVRIVFSNTEGDTVTFKGLINEEATRLDVQNETINFRVLSFDSILRSVGVGATTIANGTLASEAIYTILNQPEITAILTVSSVNINPSFDFAIDDGSKLGSQSVFDALTKLMQTTSSVVTIDASDVIYITSREPLETTTVLNLYGPYDIKQRENILNLDNFNNGKQRMFNSVVVQETERTNDAFVAQFGFRQKSFTAEYITDSDTKIQVADNLVDEFKAPKIELEVTVETHLALDYNLLDLVSVNYPRRARPPDGTWLPIYGQDTYASTDTPYPYMYGSININPTVAFKIIEINHDVTKFQTTLKLRQIGKDLHDGYFSAAGSRYGSSRYSIGIYQP